MSFRKRMAARVARYFARVAGLDCIPSESFYIGDSSGGVSLGRDALRRDGWKRLEAFIRTTGGRVDMLDKLKITEAARGPSGGFAFDFNVDGEPRGVVK